MSTEDLRGGFAAPHAHRGVPRLASASARLTRLARAFHAPQGSRSAKISRKLMRLWMDSENLDVRNKCKWALRAIGETTMLACRPAARHWIKEGVRAVRVRLLCG